jgi:hypothetical protein
MKPTECNCGTFCSLIDPRYTNNRIGHSCERAASAESLSVGYSRTMSPGSVRIKGKGTIDQSNLQTMAQAGHGLSSRSSVG